MHISSFRVENYKSFRATEEIRTAPGFNVIVGQNNAGKTALMEALSLSGGNKPHRSLKSAAPCEGGVKPGEQVGNMLVNVLKGSLYAVKAARFNDGLSRAGQSGDLATNAVNLPEVLAVLQGRNPKRFKRLTSLLNVVF